MNERKNTKVTPNGISVDSSNALGQFGSTLKENRVWVGSSRFISAHILTPYLQQMTKSGVVAVPALAAAKA